ncbi:MAG: ABC transporter permease [Candidatus Bipolaricaulota bacterium]|nr:MAG: ABC transporter permease [Candidatus Bipolaricaulota bacterium]
MDRKRIAGLLSSTTGLALTVGIAFVIVIILIFVLSKEPGRAIYYFFVGPFTKSYYFGNMLNQSIGLIFTGLGIAVAFRSSTFNLGGEGQAYAGAMAATVICLSLPSLTGIVGGTAAILGAIATGAFLAGLSGFFRMRWGTDQLISSFLISAAVILIVNYLVTGPLDDPTNSMLTTARIGQQYQFLRIFKPSKLDISIVFAVAAAIATYFFMQRSHWGYEMRMCGINREFSRYAGINVAKYLMVPMAISGGFHGLAGAVAVMGTHYRCLKGVTAGLGWNGIAVALIAKNNPVAVIPAALFFAYLDAGARAAMLHADVTFELAKIAQAVIFFLVTAQALYGFFTTRKRVAA